jgi:membrane protease YdiL (CAAX protease family)
MTAPLRTLAMLVGAALFAVLLTALASGVWGALLMVNLKVSPALPWSAAVMAGLLWLMWSYIRGAGPPAATREPRRAALRGGSVSCRVWVWAVLAGVLWIGCLSGFWIVLHRLVATPGNPLPDISRLPAATVAVSLAAASISGAVSEEAGFRGYLQGALERRRLGPAAILITALTMAPVHALTQGFVWPNMLFYLLVDTMLGALAYVTGSILPGIAVHALGLMTFFVLVWPGDAHRAPVRVGIPDAWFWVHVGQAALFAPLAILAFMRLAHLCRSDRATRRAPG